jgi:hypothetical protein
MGTEFQICKGAGKSVEFLGLKAQYLIGFIAGVVGIFLGFVVLKLIGVHILVIIVILGAFGGIFLRYMFLYNKKYGQYGRQKVSAYGNCPRFIINRLSFYSMLKDKEDGDT